MVDPLDIEARDSGPCRWREAIARQSSTGEIENREWPMTRRPSRRELRPDGRTENSASPGGPRHAGLGQEKALRKGGLGLTGGGHSRQRTRLGATPVNREIYREFEKFQDTCRHRHVAESEWLRGLQAEPVILSCKRNRELFGPNREIDEPYRDALGWRCRREHLGSMTSVGSSIAVAVASNFQCHRL